MIYLIGHRGVGKTTVTRQLKAKFKVFDLDEEIASVIGTSITTYFKNVGEESFRKLEVLTLNKLKLLDDVDIISLGAGFPLDKLKKNNDDVIIWLRRASDSLGRVFLDRPRLNVGLTPLAEYQQRFKKREEFFKLNSDFEVYVEENDSKHFCDLLGAVLLNKEFDFNGRLTVKKDKNIFNNVSLEYRTDLLSESEILKSIKQEDLVAVRTKVSKSFMRKVSEIKNIEIDLPLEQLELALAFRENTKHDGLFISSHEDLEEEQIIDITQKKGFHLKWAPEVKSFKDLIRIDSIKNKYNISFLPRSLNTNKWQWYRALNFFNNRFNFFRFSKGSDLNQPFWYQQILKKEKNINQRLGCVIGSPVDHSYSPAFHKNFFNGYYYRIEISEDEMSLEVLDFIFKMGISYISITSPLKNKISDLLNVEKPVNTLFYSKSGVNAYNSDLSSIEKLVKSLEGKRVCVWGAGAIGRQFDEKLNDSELFSVREHGLSKIDKNFDVLLWCAGDAKVAPNFNKDKLPNEVYDIDYKESSKAKEYALVHSLSYTSGLDFFNIQAKGQQDWWLSEEEKE